MNFQETCQCWFTDTYFNKATLELANFICREKRKTKGVVIAYDSRRMTPVFEEEAALCLAGNGIFGTEPK